MKIISIIAIVIVALLGFGVATGRIDLGLTHKGRADIKEARGKTADWVKGAADKAADKVRE